MFEESWPTLNPTAAQRNHDQPRNDVIWIIIICIPCHAHWHTNQPSCASSGPSSSSSYASPSGSTSHHVIGPFKYLGVFLCSRCRALCTTTNLSAFLEVSLFLLIEWINLYVDQFPFAIEELAIQDNKRIEKCLSFGAPSPCNLHQPIGLNEITWATFPLHFFNYLFSKFGQWGCGNVGYVEGMFPFFNGAFRCAFRCIPLERECLETSPLEYLFPKSSGNMSPTFGNLSLCNIGLHACRVHIPCTLHSFRS